MNVFTFLDYRALLHEVVEERKHKSSALSYSDLAQIAGVKKSYFSKVVHGKAELSQDQLYLLAKYLAWDEDELRYVELLLELSRCKLTERKRSLHERIESLRKHQLKESKKKQSTRADLADFVNPKLPLLRSLQRDHTVSERLLFAGDLETHQWLKSQVDRLLSEAKNRVVRSKQKYTELYELSVDFAKFE